MWETRRRARRSNRCSGPKERYETAVLADLIRISPEVRARASEILAKMSPLARSQLAINHPDQLVAFLYSHSPLIDGLRVINERPRDLQNSDVTAELQLPNGRMDTIDFEFKLESGGWRYVLVEPNAIYLLDHWEEYLALGRNRKPSPSR